MDNLLSDEELQKILDLLREKKATKPCPRCGGELFTLVDGYFIYEPQAEITHTPSMVAPFGGLFARSVPCVKTICNKCGFLAEHAIGALGLLPKNINDKGETNE